MAIDKRTMVNMIKRNGHLVLEGDESTTDLHTALLYLRQHTYMKCHNPGLGDPMEALIPDPSVLAIRSLRSRNVESVRPGNQRL